MSYVRDPIIWARAHYALSVKYGRLYYEADSSPPRGKLGGGVEGGTVPVASLSTSPDRLQPPSPPRVAPPAQALCNFVYKRQ
ncbi:unnamed protein product [Pieris brassicae]|uniref:Uncharacterized protein n=1 Tax=Pieris brassicae TaxID=7116 RepID=A0A9P0TG02_PIEBR|nr:unnamed protein product [Pieris brassicae]